MSNVILNLYHGSDHIVEKPQFGVGREDNDYGSGFYTTEIVDLAEEWALLYGAESAVVNAYQLDTSSLNVLSLDNLGPLAWIAEVVSHRGVSSPVAKTFSEDFVRKYKPNTDTADIIIGYRADDSYGDIIESFLSGEITVTEVQKLFWKGELGHQVFLKSRLSFDRLMYLGSRKPKLTDHIGESIRYARQEVLNFLQNRRIQIARRFRVPPISSIDALEHNYIYYQNQQEFGYYESR